ncbi:unnamed protein product, partial [Didymodactylos carnosus]
FYDTFIDQFSGECSNFAQKVDVADFFYQCFKYLPEVEKEIEENIYVSVILVRMIGLLHFDEKNTLTENGIRFIDILLQRISNEMEIFFGKMKNTDWLLVTDGLTNLLWLKFQFYHISPENDTITFLSRVPNADQKQQQQIADLIAKKSLSSNFIIQQPNWLDLFTMTTDDALIVECLHLATTFTDYIMYAERLLNTKTVPDIQEKIANKLQQLIEENHFEITLENILLFFQSLQTNCTDDLCNIIEKCQELPSVIANYLNKVRINDINQLNSIRQILTEYYNPFLLGSIIKTQYIITLLTRHSFTKSGELGTFYTKWFNCFLCDPYHDNTKEETEIFQYLLSEWLRQITLNREIYSDLIKSIDILIEMLENTENKNNVPSLCVNIFLQSILTLYFNGKQDLFRLINEIEINIRNNRFIEAFKIKYKINVAEKNQFIMKQMNNMQNPLIQLLQNAKKYPTSRLIPNLMEICTDIITLRNSEIFLESISSPDRESFLSLILFEPHFKNFKIHQAALNELLERVHKKQTSMGLLFSAASREMEEKLNIKKKVQLCLTTYCREADDFDQLQILIDQTTKQLTSATIKSVQIPNELTQVIPFAGVLNRYSTSETWYNYRKIHEENYNNQRSSEIIASREPLINEEDHNQRMQQKQEEIKSLPSEQWNTTSVKTIMSMFKNIQLIDQEMDILRPLLQVDSIKYLTAILNYSKNRKYVKKTCRGIQNLAKFHNLSGDYSLFHTLIEMTLKSSGKDCYASYQQFTETYTSKQPENTFIVCSQYYDSYDLVNFVKKLNRTDMDNLLQAVNDWDESFINTQTVVDFVQLGRFLDSVDSYIATKQPQVMLNDVLQHITTLLKQKEYLDVVNCFKSCVASLSGIQRLYLELTDKEESKRTKIFNIVNNSSMQFVSPQQQPLRMKYDICLQTQTGEKLYYNDLNELRDRARLIEYSGNEKMVLQLQQQQYTKEQEKFFLRCLVTLVDTIENMLNNMNHLNVMGYPLIEQNTKKQYTCTSCDFKDIQTFQTQLKDILRLWEENIIRLYQSNHDLTYLSGKQFWIIEDALLNYKQLEPNHPGYHLLRYIGIEKLSPMKFNIDKI